MAPLDTPAGGHLPPSAAARGLPRRRGAGHEGRPAGDTRRPTILIVDDDVNLVRQAQSCLADLAELFVALTGADALRVCRRVQPDLILLDLQLGDVDGLSLLAELRADPRLAGVPVVVASASAGDAGRGPALALGVAAWLPKPLDAARLRAGVAAALRARPAARTEPPPLVLAVDDDANARDAMAAALADPALRFMAADGAEAALGLVSQWVPDVVLLDLSLPVTDGFELARRLLEFPAMADVPIIVVTQHGDAESELRALAMGAFDFVGKPFAPAVLRARVGNALRLRRRQQHTLQQAEDHWRRVGGSQLAAIVAHAQDAIVSLHDDGRIALANAAAQRLLGAGGARGAEGELPAWLRAGLPPALLDGTERQARDVSLTPPGGPTSVYDISATADDSAGRRLLTLTLRDQTPRLQAETQAREHLRLQAESGAKQRMVSYLAHEIGNPLGGIVGMVRLMLGPKADPLTEQQRRRLDTVLEAAEVLQRLMSDTLELARWDASRFDITPGPVLLPALLEQVRDEMAPVALQTDVVIEPPATFGAGPVPAAWADRIRLRQCLLNLVSNACKYGRPGGRVQLSAGVDGERVAVTVADDGVGMSAEQLERLYVPFDRLGRRGAPGHGLGMAVTQMLVQAMKGELRVQSEPGRGSRFTILLPCGGENADGR